MKINPLRSVLENLVDLVNFSNTATGLAFTIEQVTFDNVGVRTSDINPNDSTIEVTAVPGKGFRGGPDTITYMRQGLDKGVAPEELEIAKQFTVEGNDVVAEAKLLADMATQLRLVPGEFFIDGGSPLSSVLQGADPRVLNIVPKINGKLYNVGVNITVEWPNPLDPDIADLILIKDMDGFQPY